MKNLPAITMGFFSLIFIVVVGSVTYTKSVNRTPAPPSYEGCLRYETGRQSILQAAVDWSNSHSKTQVFCFNPEDTPRRSPLVFCSVANLKYIYNLACFKTHCELSEKRLTVRERERLKKAPINRTRAHE